MVACQFGEEYLRRTMAQSASRSVNEALDIIRKHLYSEVRFARGPPSATMISRAAALVHPSVRGRRSGVYLPSTNEVIFVEGLSCVKTAVHETLHAVSSLCQLQEAQYLDLLFEGLNECLTGYLLYKAYQQSYSNCWKTDNPELSCRMTYEPTCRLWGSFFRFVPIKTIIPLYLQLPPDWKRMCTRFADCVRQSGYGTFRDVLGNILDSTEFITDQTFKNECARVFGKRFRVFCGTIAALDFSQSCG
jgi:hypothetical protein